MSSERVYCGRVFGEKDLEAIRELIANNPKALRAQLSRLVCEQLSWRKVDGRLKDMSCRVAMLRMQDDELITLPPPRNSNNNGKPYLRRTLLAEPRQSPITLSAGKLPDLSVEPLVTSEDSHLWNEFIDRYHYLGYQPLPGAQLRYFARSKSTVVALLGFGAAAWKVAPRDRFIGWTPSQRKQRLHLVVNNARFLILPWVQSRNLASKLLALAARRLPKDWEARHSYRPVLLETFVETARFKGTCYKAANWVQVGHTQGRGKLDTKHRAALPTKSIWLYPLAPNFRHLLCS